jgi:hypothetical protein
MIEWDMKSYLTKVGFCPNCHNKIDAASGVNPEQEGGPEAGDVSVCFYCAEFLEFLDRGRVRVLPEEVFKGLPVPIKEQLVATQIKIQVFISSKRSGGQ